MMIEESENARADNQPKIPVNNGNGAKPFKKNSDQANANVSSKTDEESRRNSSITEKFPELLFMAQKPGKNHLDIDELSKSIKPEVRPASTPDPTTKILNPEINNIKFVGYHSTPADLVKAEQPVESEKETYEQWLSQHKAIIMSSRKENRQSKAPSLKDVKEAERTKFIKLDVNDVLKNQENHQDEYTPIETKTYKNSKQPTTKEKSVIQLKSDTDIATQKSFFDLTIRKNIKDTPTEKFNMRSKKSESKQKETDDKKSSKKQETDNCFGKSPEPED